MRSARAAFFIAAIIGSPLALRASCGAPANPIEAENCLPGNPDTEWNVTGAGDLSIQGYATEISVQPGDPVTFKVMSDAAAYRLDIYRMGYYNGSGARKVATVLPSVSLPQTQPACQNDATTGLIDCGNWAPSASWTVPSNAVSGIYFARLVRTDNGGASHIMFIVRNDASTSKILFQTSDTTWQAYNSYGGNSFYVGSPAGRAYKVSYNRPFITRQANSSFAFTHEYPMVRWLEANGYDVSYFTGMDSDRRGNLIRNHTVFLSVGHDEYWSAAQRNFAEAARNAGVHMMFLSGNEAYWKTRWENSIVNGTPYRTLVCYKETFDGPIDPSPTWTGSWRDAEFSPPGDGGRPENALTGTLFTVNAFRNDALTVTGAESKHRIWRNTTVASLAPGSSVSFPQIVGYEWDEDVANGVRPAGLMQLSSATYFVDKHLIDAGRTYVPAYATHHLTLYRYSSGALVFGAGTMQWSWGLDNHRNNGTGLPAAVALQQATVNMLADMNVMPATLRPGLVPASPSTDTTPPQSVITSPANGASVALGSIVIISGTASDTGGIVGGVEVSTSNGAAWFPATGRANWTFSWKPVTAGAYTIKSRAVDDTGNLQTPSAGITVTVGGSGVSPTISTLSPSNSVVGGSSFTLTVAGTDFTASSIVRWGGVDRTTTFISATQVKAAILLSDLSNRGFVKVTVFNPGGGISNEKTFTVRLVPVLSSLNPASKSPGGGSFTLTVNGNKFDTDSIVQWKGANRATVFVSSTQLTATILSSDTAVIGTYPVTVSNPSPGGVSNAVAFSVNSSGSPLPTLAGINPTNARVNSATFTLVCTGTNFISGSVIRWNDANRATSFVNATEVRATIPASDLKNRGYVTVKVFNPGATGGVSAGKTFTIRLVPAIASLNPPSANSGGPAFTLTILGSGFASDSQALWNGAARTTTFVSTTQIKAAIPAADIADPQIIQVSVSNPSPGGVSSNKPFTIIDCQGGACSSIAEESANLVALINRVYPNPWRANRHQGMNVTFNFVEPNFEVRIFTVDGRSVRTLNASTGIVQWDLNNTSGEAVASGYYLYMMHGDDEQQSTGKLAILR